MAAFHWTRRVWLQVSRGLGMGAGARASVSKGAPPAICQQNS